MRALIDGTNPRRSLPRDIRKRIEVDRGSQIAVASQSPHRFRRLGITKDVATVDADRTRLSEQSVRGVTKRNLAKRRIRRS